MNVPLSLWVSVMTAQEIDMKRIIAFIITFLLWSLLCFYGGADFLERSPINAYLVFVGLVFGYMAAIYPGF